VITEAVILAGGFGTRLQTVVNDVPKPMAPVDSQPFLNYVFSYLKHYGIKHVVLSTGYLSHKISECYKEAYQGISISYAVEETPLGTGGGIRFSLQQCNTNEVLVLNGDSFFDVKVNEYYEQHSTSKADCSLALRKVDNAARYGTIRLGDDNRIAAFKEKDSIEQPGLINGGVYILNKELFMAQTPDGKAFSIEKDFFETSVSQFRICGFEYGGYFIDIGIPDDYHKAQDDFKRFTYR
jgi:D-glycero-alpha-D-manno-heptose 1-phosphate guanylyltransferase